GKLSGDPEIQTALQELDLQLFTFILACSGYYPSTVRSLGQQLSQGQLGVYQTHPIYSLVAKCPELGGLRQMVLKARQTPMDQTADLLGDYYGRLFSRSLKNQGLEIDDLREMPALERTVRLGEQFPSAQDADMAEIATKADREMSAYLELPPT